MGIEYVHCVWQPNWLSKLIPIAYMTILDVIKLVGPLVVTTRCTRAYTINWFSMHPLLNMSLSTSAILGRWNVNNLTILVPWLFNPFKMHNKCNPCLFVVLHLRVVCILLEFHQETTSIPCQLLHCHPQWSQGYLRMLNTNHVDYTNSNVWCTPHIWFSVLLESLCHNQQNRLHDLLCSTRCHMSPFLKYFWLDYSKNLYKNIYTFLCTRLDN